jgi:fused signal recognition particle receptor
MFSFFKKKITPEASSAPESSAIPNAPQMPAERPRASWIARLGQGLRRTGQSISTVFTGTQIDDDLYEELETALLMADAGVQATEYLLADLKKRVKDTSTTEPLSLIHI